MKNISYQPFFNAFLIAFLSLSTYVSQCFSFTTTVTRSFTTTTTTTSFSRHSFIIHDFTGKIQRSSNYLLKLQSSNISTENNNKNNSQLTADDNDTSADTSSTKLLIADIRRMRVKEIKQQLDDVNISTTDCFEKEELVQRLYNYKISAKHDEGTSNVRQKVEQKDVNNNDNDDGDDTIIRIPMEFHSLTSQSVKSKNSNNLYLRPTPGKFPSISVTLPNKENKKTNVTSRYCMLRNFTTSTNYTEFTTTYN
jgi:hemerythrin